MKTLTRVWSWAWWLSWRTSLGSLIFLFLPGCQSPVSPDNCCCWSMITRDDNVAHLDQGFWQEPLDLPDQRHQPAPLVLLVLHQTCLRVHDWNNFHESNNFQWHCRKYFTWHNICDEVGKLCVDHDQLPQHWHHLVPLDLEKHSLEKYFTQHYHHQPCLWLPAILDHTDVSGYQ